MIYAKANQEIESPMGGQLIKMDSSGEAASVSYSTYEELPNHYANEQKLEDIFSQLLESSKEKLNWKVHFDVLENLRILNKYQNKEFLSRISFFLPFLILSIDNLRSNVSKNALVLIKEIIHQSYEGVPSEEMILKVLPLVLDKSISDKGFIKSEAKNALKELEKNGCWDVSIYILGEKCFDKNAHVCEMSMQTLLEVVKNVKENVTAKLSKNGLRILFKTLAKNLEGKRAMLKKMSEEALRNVSGFVLKNGSFEEYLKYEIELSDTEINMIQSALTDKKNKSSKADLQKFLQERKIRVEGPEIVEEKVLSGGSKGGKGILEVEENNEMKIKCEDS